MNNEILVLTHLDILIVDNQLIRYQTSLSRCAPEDAIKQVSIYETVAIQIRRYHFPDHSINELLDYLSLKLLETRTNIVI